MDLNESIFPEPIICPITIIFRLFFLDRCNRPRLGLCWANLVRIGCNFELTGWVTVEGHAPYLGVKSIGGDNLYGFKVQVATLHVFSGSTKNANNFLFRCTKELAKEYKFVLAFEKSLCKDYISDYFYQVGFKKNICIGLEITE